jgi:hypothetical protein
VLPGSYGENDIFGLATKSLSLGITEREREGLIGGPCVDVALEDHVSSFCEF